MKKKWPYLETESRLASSLVMINVLEVAPNETLTRHLSIIYRKIHAKYTLKIKGQYSGRMITLRGDWSGIYPVKDLIQSKTEDS